MTTTGPESGLLRRILPYAIVALVAFAVGGLVYHLVRADDLRGDGYRIGLSHGEVKAAREGPPQVRDVTFDLGALAATPAWRSLGALEPEEQAGLAFLANRAPTPCRRLARRGHSIAATLLDPDLSCAGSGEQLGLGLAALRSFPGDEQEALAVLRVERRARPDLEGRPLRGNPDADVVVVEYGDFQCPYCTRALALTDALLEERDDVAVAFKHLPLSFHPAARPAALAVEAAAEQDRFWEMHDALFALGKGIADHVPADKPVPDEGPVPFESLAAELGLDVPRFRSDFRSDAVSGRVDADTAEARALGVSGTPTFFVDARKVKERLNVTMLSRLVDKARAEREWRFSWDLQPPPPGVQGDDDDSSEAGPE